MSEFVPHFTTSPVPKVSVVISTYNRPDRLKTAIESVIAQTYQDWECIVAYDGMEISPEGVGTGSKFLHLPAKHFGCDTKPKNKGILEAKGEYVAFLDDDNTWRPDHLQSLVTCLEQNPDVAMAYGDRFLIDETGKIPPQLGIFSEFSPSLLLKRNYIDTSDVLVRKSALQYVGGFDETQTKYIDWNLWVRMAKAGFKFKRVPLVLTNYHLHESQKSLKVKTDAEVKAKQPGFLPDWDPFDCEIRLPYLGKIPEPRVAVFSLTYDRLEYTKKSFESLDKTAGYPFDHFVVDNGSKDETQAYLNRLAGVTIISNPENRGISKASNQAIDLITEAGDYDIIVKFDNDCLALTDGWLKAMVDIWKSNHMLALSPYVQGLKDNPGGAPRIGYGQIKGQLVGMTKHLGGICHFVSAKAYEKFRWDEQDFLHGMQDLELSQYLLVNGYQMGYLENFFVTHIDGTEGQHKKYPEYFERRKLEKTTRYGEAIQS